VICEAGRVSSTPTPPEDADPPYAGMPPSVRVAVIVMSVLAGLLLLYSGLIWVNRQRVIDAVVEDGGLAREDGLRFILVQLSPLAVLGLVLAVSALFLARRRPWARWLALAAVVLMALLTLSSVLLGAAVTILTLLFAVLSMASIASLMARTTTAWLPRRGERPTVA
jgi:hypothetical protein